MGTLIKAIASYLLLALTVVGGYGFWQLTLASFNEAQNAYAMEQSWVYAVVLSPAFAYLILLLTIALVIKEFFVSNMRARLIANTTGVMVVLACATVLTRASDLSPPVLQ